MRRPEGTEPRRGRPRRGGGGGEAGAAPPRRLPRGHAAKPGGDRPGPAAEDEARADDPAYAWTALERAEILGLAEGYRSAARIARERTPRPKD